MAREYWYLLAAVLLALPLLALLAVKKLHLLDPRPDRQITYKLVADQPLTLHLFTAANAGASTPAPAVLFFHGGGWRYGGPEAFYPQCRFLSAQGFHCVSAQYRLGSDNRPDIRGAIEDARSALNYLAEHAARLHIDPRRIVVGGGSSGGHLAAALGTALALPAAGAATAHDRRPAALVLYNPILDFSPGTAYHALGEGYWEQVSPARHIDAAVPPTLILVGSLDAEVPLATVRAFCAAVHGAGGRCESAIYEGQGHGFFNQPRYREQTNARVLEFLSSL